MNTCTRILSASIVAWLCLVAWGSAQVEPEGNLNLLVTDDLLVPPGSYHGDEIVFRNRIGGMSITAMADIIAMQRVDNHSFPLLTNGPGGTEAVNSSSLRFPMRVGPRLNLILNDILFGGDLELGYMRIDGFSLSKRFTSDATPLYCPTPIGGTDIGVGEGIAFNYISRLSIGEANLRYGLGDRFALLAGFRYIDLHEQLDAVHLVPGVGDTRFITANTDNHLYGFQLGTEISFINLKKFFVSGVAKAGIFSNQADLSLYGPDGTADYSGVKGQLAFVGEVDLVASYLITDNMAIRLGYQAMWMQGMALAVDQFHMDGSEYYAPGWYPDTKGSLFYHGAFLGLEISY